MYLLHDVILCLFWRFASGVAPAKRRSSIDRRFSEDIQLIGSKDCLTAHLTLEVLSVLSGGKAYAPPIRKLTSSDQYLLQSTPIFTPAYSGSLRLVNRHAQTKMNTLTLNTNLPSQRYKDFEYGKLSSCFIDFARYTV
jgi:hypothetical protein